LNRAADDACERETTTVVDVSKNGAEDERRAAGLDQETALEGATDPGHSSPVDVEGRPSMPAQGVFPVEG
jgi:hypothetical protein